MGRRLVFKIALVLVAATVTYLALRDRTPPLVERVRGDDVLALPGPMTGLRTAIYDRSDIPLWTDRSYHTAGISQRLKGLAWVPIGRNEARPYILEVTTRTTLFTLANREDMRGIRDWTMLADSVLVDDVYPPRRFDVILALEVEPAFYAVRSPEGGPSRPVFFDPEVVELVQR